MFDPSDDLGLVADGLETVALLRRGSASGDGGTIVVGALRRAMTAVEATIVASGDVHKQVASGGRNTAADLTWHLPGAALAEAPRLGDVILDGDQQRWTILAVKRATLGARWRCAARNVAIAFGLDDTISVLRASYAKAADGALQPTWQTWKTGVRARIQPLKTEIVADEEIRGATVRYRVFVEDNLDVDHTCRIRGADGALYAIISTTGAERIGELQVIEAEEAP